MSCDDNVTRIKIQLNFTPLIRESSHAICFFTRVIMAHFNCSILGSVIEFCCDDTNNSLDKQPATSPVSFAPSCLFVQILLSLYRSITFCTIDNYTASLRRPGETYGTSIIEVSWPLIGKWTRASGRGKFTASANSIPA